MPWCNIFRSVLNEKFKGYDAKNIYMLYGSIIHAFFQQVRKFYDMSIRQYFILIKQLSVKILSRNIITFCTLDQTSQYCFTPCAGNSRKSPGSICNDKNSGDNR